MKKICAGIIATVLSITIQVHAGTAASKIEPLLQKQFAEKGSADFWLWFNEQADISQAKNLSTKNEKGEYVFKTLTSFAQHSQENIKLLLNSKNISYKSYWIANAIFIRNGSLALAEELALLPEINALLFNATFTKIQPVEMVQDNTSNEKILGIEWGITKVNADKVWALGFKGQGVVVGGQDTGYDWDHPALKNKYRGWNGTSANHNYNWFDAIKSGNGGSCGTNSQVPCDDDQHGTHTMGTMVGDDGAGNQIGMAPDAKWIGCRNMDQGFGSLNSYVDCFQWFLAPTDLNDQNPMPSKAPHVINNSWGCDGSEGCNSSNFNVMKTAVANLRAAGVVVVVSAGNSGPNCNTVTDPAAIFDESYTVGSTKNDDSMSGFSSRGNISVDGSNRVKPDISAPGSSIRSCVPGTGYSAFSGTSMAGPHVAGMVALLISARPSLAGKVDSIEYYINMSAVKINGNQTCNGTAPTTYPNNTTGYGRIDVLAAVNLALINTTGIENLSAEEFIAGVFPNPATDQIKITCNKSEENLTLLLFDAMGRKVMENKFSCDMNGYSIALSQIQSGVYQYTLINTNGQKVSGKLVKL